MRQISDSYRNIAAGSDLEPVFVAKLIHDDTTVYLTTRSIDVLDVTATQLSRKITTANFNTQSIKPEAGMSSIGDMQLSFSDSDLAFTEIMNSIDANGESIINDKVEMFFGDYRIPFDEYVRITPLYVKSFSIDTVSVTLNLTDTQRITQKSLFADPFSTELISSHGYSDTSTIEVVTTLNSVLVEHGPDWANDPNETVGYLFVDGITQNNVESREIISYTGKTATEFTGVKRARFGTARVELSSEDESGNLTNLELHEFVYIDLVQPLMVQALLTGDYGIVGASLPDHWHVNLDASLINTTSFANIGEDLHQEHIEFRGMSTKTAKTFIAEQCLAPYGTMLRIDQNGEYELSRYGYVRKDSPGDLVLDYKDMIDAGVTSRDTTKIINFFQIAWERRIGQEGYFARNDYYIDGNSQEKYKYESPLEVIELYGLRNRDKSSKISLDFVAQSMLKRYSNPTASRTVTAKLASVIELEVGNLVTIKAANETDFRTLEEYEETFEIQSIQYNFILGTASMNLFASEGDPSEFEVKYGENVVSIDTTDYVDLALEEYGTLNISEDTFTFDVGADIPSGKYEFDGDIVFPSGTVYGNGSVYIDATGNIHFNSGSVLDGIGRGLMSGVGYYGITSRGQSGIQMYDPIGPRNGYIRNNQEVISVGRGLIDLPDLVRVEDGGSIPGMPLRLDGIRGAAGGATDLDDFSGTEFGSPGAPVPGGSGFFFSCASFTYASDAVIDVSGVDGNPSGYFTTGTFYYYHGASGFSWPGAVIVALKDRGAARPFLTDIVTAKTGLFVESEFSQNPQYVWWDKSGDWRFKANLQHINSIAQPSGCRDNENKDFAASSTHVMNLVVASDHIPEPGVDPIESAPAPQFSYQEKINTPETQQGDQVTYEFTAENNSDTKYVEFEYRITEGQWGSCDNRTRLESILQLTATGEEIEIRATGYSNDSTAGGVTLQSITLPKINRNPNESDGSGGVSDDVPVEIQVPKVRKLELVNRIGNEIETYTKWKSPNAEFRWAKSSILNPSSITQMNGYSDLHLKGYKVRVRRSDTNEILREEIVSDTSYTYTFDKNKKDTNGSPVREIVFEVQAVANTGHSSEFVSFSISNPEPLAVTGITTEQVKDGIFITYTPPADVDFVGVKIRDELYTGSSITIPSSLSRFETLTIVSVDQFGDGLSDTVDISNPQPNAPSSISTQVGFTSIKVNFTNPDDFDFVGVKVEFRISGGVFSSPLLVTSNEVLVEGLSDGTEYEIRLTSVDSLGDGSSTSVIATTKSLNATDVSGLSNWATKTDPVDLVFINANMDNNSLSSDKIVNLTAAKITAGQITVQVDVGTGVFLDGANGVIQTSNNGYIASIGAVNVPSESSNSLVFYTNDGVNYPIWFDSAGSAKIGKLMVGSDGSITSDNFSIAANGSAQFTGTIGIGANGYDNISDKPTSLSDVNLSEGNKLGDIEYGATVGADWNTNVTNTPNIFSMFKNPMRPGEIWKAGITGNAVGNNPTFTYTRNGADSENKLISDTGPFGTTEVLWACIPNSLSDADGGWYSTPLQLDPDKDYAFGVYAKTLSNSGSTYLGVGGAVKNTNTTGPTNSNFYFWSGDLPSNNEWYLIVGILHNQNYTGDTSEISGIYKVSTGEKVSNITRDCCFNTDTTLYHRAYHFYNASGDGNTIWQWFARPFLMQAEDMPNIAALTTADSTALILAEKNIADNADVTTPMRISCKINYLTFDVANPGEIAFRGYGSDGQPADVDPVISVNGVTTTLTRDYANPGVACGVAYIVWDRNWSFSSDYVLMTKSNGVWTYYNEGVQGEYTPTGSELVIGIANQLESELVGSATVWGYGHRMYDVPDTGANNTDLSTIVSDGNNLIFNGAGYAKAADGRPAGCKAVYGSGNKSYVSYLSESAGQVKLYSSTDSSIGIGWPAFRVEENTKYRLTYRVKSNVTSSTGLYVRIQELDSELPSTYTHISENANSSEAGTIQRTRQITNFWENAGITSSWVTREHIYTPTATAKFASLIMLNWTDMGTTELHIDFVSIVPIVNSDADVTEVALEAGTTMGAGYIHLQGSDANIAIGNSRNWRSTGIQQQYNNGTPRQFMGNYSNGKYIEFDGSDVNLGYNTNLEGLISWNQKRLFSYDRFNSHLMRVRSTNGMTIRREDDGPLEGVGGFPLIIEPTSSNSSCSSSLGITSSWATVLQRPVFDISTMNFRQKFAFALNFSGTASSTDYAYIGSGYLDSTAGSGSFIGVQFVNSVLGDEYARYYIKNGSSTTVGPNTPIDLGSGVLPYYEIITDCYNTGNEARIILNSINQSTGVRTEVFNYLYTGSGQGFPSYSYAGGHLNSCVIDVNSNTFNKTDRKVYLMDYMFAEYP